jgi:hypothetical protein
MPEDNDKAPAKAKATTTTQPERKSAAEKVEASLDLQRDNREAAMEPADVGAAPAKAIEGSGAIVEPSIKSAIDVDHPAVDNNPRAGTTVRQNQTDFNDPSLKDEEAVAENLDRQS